MNKPFEILYDGTDPIRLDQFLSAEFSEASRSRILQYIKEGRVSVNGKPAVKGGHWLRGGDRIELTLPEERPSALVPEERELDILYEDENTIILNKPAGVVVHPSFGHESGTIVHAVLAHCKDLQSFGGEIRPGVVHRLDRDTSGILILAKNEKSLIFLQSQFKSREIDKRYLALVDGRPPTPDGRIAAPIGRDPKRRQMMAILPADQGRAAVTEYFTKTEYRRHTLLEARLLTGRTHQLRVHFAFLKCPIVADNLYGYRKQSIPLGRHFLHAHKVKVTLPGQTQPSIFEAPLPDELANALKELEPARPE